MGAGNSIHMNLNSATGTASNIASSVAIIIGGVWAYFKFIKGRVFARRAELSVSSKFEESTETAYLSVTVTLKNNGMSKLPLNENMKLVRVLGLIPDPSTRLGVAGWERIATFPILTQHAWLEAQEAVTDTVLCRLGRPDRADRNHEAYQVEAIVGAPRRVITGKGIRWQSRAIVFSSRPLPSAAVSRNRRASRSLTGINGLAKRMTSRESGD
jgi:hypothetical protein